MRRIRMDYESLGSIDEYYSLFSDLMNARYKVLDEYSVGCDIELVCAEYEDNEVDIDYLFSIDFIELKKEDFRPALESFIGQIRNKYPSFIEKDSDVDLVTTVLGGFGQILVPQIDEEDYYKGYVVYDAEDIEK